MRHHSFLAEVVSEETSWRVRTFIVPSGNKATTPVVSVEAMWGTVMRHSYTSRHGGIKGGLVGSQNFIHTQW